VAESRFPGSSAATQHRPFDQRHARPVARGKAISVLS